MSEYRKLGRLFACAAALLLIGALYACIEPEEAIGSATDLLKYCGVNELEGVADLRRISDDCKEALRDLLPDYEDNLAHALVPLGSGIFDDRTTASRAQQALQEQGYRSFLCRSI